MKKILVYDSDPSGHRLSYWQSFLAGLAQGGGERASIVMVTNPRLASELGQGDEQTDIRCVSEHTAARLKSSHGIFRRSLADVRELRKWIRREKPDRCVLLDLNSIMPVAGITGCSILGCPVSGIYFRSGDILLTGGGARTYVRRYLLAKWLADRRVRAVGLLNEWHRVHQFNAMFGTTKFRALADPIPLRALPAPGQSLRTCLGIPCENMVCLMVGIISPRKGIDHLLAGVRSLSEDMSRRVTIVIMGQCKEDYRAPLMAAIARLKKEKASLQIVLIDRHLTDDEIDTAVLESNAVLLPYVENNTSSGILGIAARLGVPAIVSEGGLLADLVREYGLGRAIQFSPGEELRQMIDDLVEKEIRVDECGVERYLNANSCEAFCRGLLA